MKRMGNLQDAQLRVAGLLALLAGTVLVVLSR